MECPNCGHELRPALREGVEVDECAHCGGTWFDRDELRQAKDSADPDLRWLDFDVFAADGPPGALAQRNCPKCGSTMRSRTYMESNVAVEACPSQHGVWLDGGEFDRIIEYLDKVVVTSSSGEYTKNALEELREVVTGPESRLSELKDLFAVVRLLQYRVGAEHPGAAQVIGEVGRRF